MKYAGRAARTALSASMNVGYSENERYVCVRDILLAV
jgi:hypothetical protein